MNTLSMIGLAAGAIFVVVWLVFVDRFVRNFTLRADEQRKLNFGLSDFVLARVRSPGESSSIRVKEGLKIEIKDKKVLTKSRVTRALTHE